MIVRLKAVIFNTDFRHNEMHIYDTFLRSRKCPGPLGAGEAFVFISRNGDQILWMFSSYDVDKTIASGRREGAVYGTTRVVDSRKMRIESGRWSPRMLGNYARLAGLELEGVKLFEEQFYESRKRKRRGSR